MRDIKSILEGIVSQGKPVGSGGSVFRHTSSSSNKSGLNIGAHRAQSHELASKKAVADSAEKREDEVEKRNREAKQRRNETMKMSEELQEEIHPDYKLVKTGKKSTTAHPDGKPTYDIHHKGKKVATLEPSSAYKDTKIPGKRYVASRKDITKYAIHSDANGLQFNRHNRYHNNSKDAAEYFVQQHQHSLKEETMTESKHVFHVHLHADDTRLGKMVDDKTVEPIGAKPKGTKIKLTVPAHDTRTARDKAARYAAKNFGVHSVKSIEYKGLHEDTVVEANIGPNVDTETIRGIHQRAHASITNPNNKKLTYSHPGFADQIDNELKARKELAKRGIKVERPKHRAVIEHKLEEAIKGWKNAASDIRKQRSAASDAKKSAVLVSLKKDGSESGMHDAKSYHASEEEARKKHETITKLNPNRKIRHNLYVDGKKVDTLGEETINEIFGFGKKSDQKDLPKYPEGNKAKEWMTAKLNHALKHNPKEAHHLFSPASPVYMPKDVHAGSEWKKEHQDHYRELKKKHPDLVQKAKKHMESNGPYIQSRVGDDQDYHGVKLREETNTEKREKIENVARMDGAKPTSEKSTLSKTGQIKTKIVEEKPTMSLPNFGLPKSLIDAVRQIVEKKDEDEKDPKKMTGGKTAVDLDPETDDKQNDDDAAAKGKKKAVKEETKSGTEPKTEKEKKLAALASPKDKITHKDVLVGRGVVKEEEVEDLIENTMSVKDAYKLQDKHRSAAEYARKAGDKKAYNAHMQHSASIEDKLIQSRNGSTIAGKSLAAKSEKIFKEHPYGIKEEVEGIEEVSKDTLQRYMHSAKSERMDPTKGGQRKAGMDLALKKSIGSKDVKVKAAGMSKKEMGEEVDQLDELKRSTLASYVKKAATSSGSPRDLEHLGQITKTHPDARDKILNKMQNRQMGIVKAADRLAKEEVEFSEEELARIADIASSFQTEIDEAVKKSSAPTTATSAPTRGANQDQSGFNTKNSTADYTISDEKKLRKEEVDLQEAIKIGSRVKVHAPGKDYHGVIGNVGEIDHGLHKKSEKKYTVDYNNRSNSVTLPKSQIKLHKEEVEIEEGRGRPRKNPLPAGQEAEVDDTHKHPMQQLEKIAHSIEGREPHYEHKDGSKTKVGRHLARHMVMTHNSMKTTQEKDDFANKLHANRDSMRSAMSKHF